MTIASSYADMSAYLTRNPFGRTRGMTEQAAAIDAKRDAANWRASPTDNKFFGVLVSLAISRNLEGQHAAQKF